MYMFSNCMTVYTLPSESFVRNFCPPSLFPNIYEWKFDPSNLSMLRSVAIQMNPELSSITDNVFLLLSPSSMDRFWKQSSCVRASCGERTGDNNNVRRIVMMCLISYRVFCGSKVSVYKEVLAHHADSCIFPKIDIIILKNDINDDHCRKIAL